MQFFFNQAKIKLCVKQEGHKEKPKIEYEIIKRMHQKQQGN